ncbi:MAG: UvrD-helicase domain-containing protein [Pseudomonadota bacterium]
MGLPPYLDGLNAPQRQAVEIMDGPVLLLAGAGTGKTRALTTRLAHLIHQRRAWPSQILAVTFTNKAAREMKNRVGQLIGGAVEGMPWLGTFHSVCVKILRRHAELVELKSSFTILDTDDQIRLIKQLLDAEGIDIKRWPARMFASMLDRWKNKALGPGQVPPDECGFANGRGAELYRAYQDRLKTLNAVDFGDLLLHVVHILQRHEDVLADYQTRFRYILVDEYQDTNVAQYLLLRLLAREHRNICCVGDDDQSIYGWRGAEVGNILRFEKDFEGAAVIRLEQNYRSTPHILAAASGVIAANSDRLGKTLWTEANDGEKVRLIGHWDGEEEARWIAEEVEAFQGGTRGHDPVSLDDQAILVRASFQMRAFEDRFLTIGLPYRVIGGPRFYERMEIRDAMAYFRVCVSPDDGLALERIINTPKRGIGDKALQTLNQIARGNGIGLLDACRIAVEEGALSSKANKALGELVGTLDYWGTSIRRVEARKRELDQEIAQIKDDLRSIPKGIEFDQQRLELNERLNDAEKELAELKRFHVELAQQLLDGTGYTGMWQADKSPDAQGRLENLKELVQALEDFENLQGFLEHVSLVMDNESEDGTPKISIMTLHAAKGLEFPVVFLPGWEDGLFPSQRSMDENGLKGVEEERRLAYVGMTRAEEHLTISFAANRHIYGRWQSSMPSRYIDELPPDHVDVLTPPGLYGGTYGAASPVDTPAGSVLEERATRTNTYNSPGWRRMNERRGQKGLGQPREARSLVIDAEAISAFETGDRVFHQKFGYGLVSSIEGDKLTVLFEKAGEKKVVASYVTPAAAASSDVPF